MALYFCRIFCAKWRKFKNDTKFKKFEISTLKKQITALRIKTIFSIFEHLNWSLTSITMGKVDNPIDTIIQQKGFGIWPQDVVQVEQDDPLITALNIEYRFQQHLTINKLDGLIPLQNPDSKIDIFIEESKSLLALSSGLDPITKFILLINVGHFKFIQNQINDSIDILKAADLNFGSHANNYIQS